MEDMVIQSLALAQANYYRTKLKEPRARKLVQENECRCLPVLISTFGIGEVEPEAGEDTITGDGSAFGERVCASAGKSCTLWSLSRQLSTSSYLIPSQ